MKISRFLNEVSGASRVTKRRQEAFDKASDRAQPHDAVGTAARLLHPGFIDLEVTDIRDTGRSARTITFTSDRLPYFEAGQFLTLVMKIGGSLVTRPYSICSAPYQTRGEHPTVEITVRRPKENGFAADYLIDNVKRGDVFKGEVGLGEFRWDPIRDSRHVTALAGGSGITPFLSMAREIRFGQSDMDLTILYGSADKDDILLKEELEACVCERVRVIHVLSGEDPQWDGERGFLSRSLIRKYSGGDTTYFVCGPQVMYDYVREELAALQVPERRIRFEVFGQARDISVFEGYPQQAKGKEFRLTVVQGIRETVIPARADESIAAALERASLRIHTACRSGACGVCRVKVLSGPYFVCPVNDGRRSQDRLFDYVHACSAYPLGDMKVKINI